MIIVSQDKEKIINFDNMTQVYITLDKGDDDVCIRTETVDSLYEDLGYYKTGERAKEVLQEIIRALIKAKKLESANSGFGFGFDIIPPNTVYEMPTE